MQNPISIYNKSLNTMLAAKMSLKVGVNNTNLKASLQC